MHAPRPHGLAVDGSELSEDDMSLIGSLSKRLTNLKTLYGLPSLKMVRTLPSGGYLIAQDMGGVFKVIVSKPSRSLQTYFDGEASEYIPMLFSGAVIKDRVYQDDTEQIVLAITEFTRRRLVGYNQGITLPSKRQSLNRFKIAYNEKRVPELMPQTESPTFYSQYVQQRPTWYSGAMAEVMQIVGGYGRQDFQDLPNSEIERAQFRLPKDVMLLAKQQMGRVRLPGYSGKPPKNGQFQYDYKFNHTHGVAFSNTGSPWLILIKPSGVFAMPLPIVPITATDAFKFYIESVADNEINSILLRFGGLPSGESFPDDEASFEAWRRAGVIIKLCNTLDFYDHSAYSTTIGWAFNRDGNQAINTCFDYDDNTGVSIGMTYLLTLSMGDASYNGRLHPSFNTENPTDQQKINAYLSRLYTLMGSLGGHKEAAIKYKLRRSGAEAVLSRYRPSMGIEEGIEEIDYWDSLEMPPIAAHTGVMSIISKGSLYHPAKQEGQPQIKFPEPLWHGCISHDFSPAPGSVGKPQTCDTIMLGYYIGNQLKTIRYFWDGRGYFKETEDNFDECMTVGSWRQTQTFGQSMLKGNFYSTEFDERETIAPVVIESSIVGKDLGYDRVPFFAFDALFWMPGTLWRNRYFSHKTITERTDGINITDAICVPYLCRNAALYAYKKTTSGGEVSENYQMHSIQDPHTYRFWTYDSVMHWAGGLEVMRGVPYPINANPVWVEIHNYSPSTCSDFADKGDWIPSLPADYAWLIHPNSNQYMLSGGGGAPSFKPYYRVHAKESSENGKLLLSMNDYLNTIKKTVPHNTYFTPSPDDATGVFYRDAAKVVFGDSVYSNVDETASNGLRVCFGQCALVDHKTAHHFIGVIHE